MQTQRPLAVITGALDGDLLNLLAQAPDVTFTTGRLHRMLTVRDVERTRSLPVVRSTLRRLTAQGIVRANTDAPVPTYQFNADHLAAPAILELARLRTLLIDRLRSVVEGWPTPPVFGALFGSAARGQMLESSDIDVLLICPDDADADSWEDQTTTLAHDVRRWTGNLAEVLAFAESEVVEHGAEKVLQDVIRDGLTFTSQPTWLARRLATMGVSR